MAVIFNRILMTFVTIMGFYAYFIMVLSLDIALTQTDHALRPINFITFLMPLILGVALIFSLKDILILPFYKGISYRTGLSSMKRLTNHPLTQDFTRCYFRVGWFGMIRMFKVQGYYYIPFKAGTIWDSHKSEYNLNPIFGTYLTMFRGYEYSSNGEYIIKKIKK